MQDSCKPTLRTNNGLYIILSADTDDSLNLKIAISKIYFKNIKQWESLQIGVIIFSEWTHCTVPHKNMLIK